MGGAMRGRMSSTIHLLGLAFIGLSASAAFADPDVKECPDLYKDLSAEQKAGEYTCKCFTAGRDFFGTGTYTTDSWICAAAIHAGVIPADTHTGNVTVKGAPGCPTYKSTEANGVTSKAWGKYESSFYFPAKGDGKCTETELPKATMKNAALEKAVADAYKREGYTDNKVLKVLLFGWDDDLEKDAFGQVTGRDMQATVVAKLPDGTCQMHYELWLQLGNGRSFSGKLEARGAGSMEELAINCDKVVEASAPAKAPAKAAPAKKK
jgi:hypothetical protein